jgi:hypothetical protein
MNVGEDSRLVPGHIFLEVEIHLDCSPATLPGFSPASLVKQASHRLTERLDVSRLINQDAAATLEKKRDISDSRSYAGYSTGETVKQEDRETFEGRCEEADVKGIIELECIGPHWQTEQFDVRVSSQLVVNLHVQRSASDKQKVDRLREKVPSKADDVEGPFLPMHSDKGAHHRFVLRKTEGLAAFSAPFFPLGGCRHPRKVNTMVNSDDTVRRYTAFLDECFGDWGVDR